jgi:hypothetical protein
VEHYAGKTTETDNFTDNFTGIIYSVKDVSSRVGQNLMAGIEKR